MSPAAVVAGLALAGLWAATGTRRPAPRSPARRPASRPAGRPARWARRGDLGPLTVRRPVPGRLTLGRLGRTLLAAEAGHSVLVVGPSQSGKTSGFAVPAILEWPGPVVATSVKADLAAHTLGWRSGLGTVWLYDPTASTGLGAAAWSPLDAAGTWVGARRMAANLVAVARAGAGPLTDGDFWYATAAKLLAPLLLAAAVSGRTMAEVVLWLDEQATGPVLDPLVSGGHVEAVRALEATWARDERQRSAVYTTAETVLEAFADPAVAASAEPGPGAVSTGALLDGPNTLYLCAPAHDQRRLRPVFATLVQDVLDTAYDRAGRRGRLEPPLLVVLDEAANVAPLAELDGLAATAAGHGVQLVTVWQDLAQLDARYGPRAGTVVNNHRVKVFLPGVADPATLDLASRLAGEEEVPQRTTTVDAEGRASVSHQPLRRALLAPHQLRQLKPGSAVVVSGHLLPARLRLRCWQDDPVLRSRAQRPTTGRPGGHR